MEEIIIPYNTYDDDIVSGDTVVFLNGDREIIKRIDDHRVTLINDVSFDLFIVNIQGIIKSGKRNCNDNNCMDSQPLNLRLEKIDSDERFEGFVDLASYKIENEDKNVIYYLSNYYNKKWIEDHDELKGAITITKSILAIKNKKYMHDKDIKNYKNYMKPIQYQLSNLSGEWIICFAPGHNDIASNTSGVFDVVDKSGIDKDRFEIIQNLLLKKYATDKKSISGLHTSDYHVDASTMKINSKYDIKEKNIIVFDDVTTLGSTLRACKKILKEAGASCVILLALGRTKEYYGQ